MMRRTQLAVMRRGIAAVNASRSSVLVAAVGPSIVVQRRTQYMQSPGKRDQEAFLAQYSPLDVLCLDEEARLQDIKDAHARLTAKYGPQGPTPDAKMLDKVRRAYEVLTDPQSPYYSRAHTSDTDRQRLMFELMPDKQRRVVQVHVVLSAVVVGLVCFLVIFMAFKPMRKAMHAATR